MTDVTEKTQARITVTSKGVAVGDMVIRFFPDVAPGHVANFVKLSKDGFYNGTTFHRIIPGFMIQGGDPNSKNPDRSMHGMGGPGHKVKAEFNSKPHKRGIVSMARSNDPDSAGSQFFICVADANFLDWQYTVFGEVVSGMEVADKVVGMKRDGGDDVAGRRARRGRKAASRRRGPDRSPPADPHGIRKHGPRFVRPAGDRADRGSARRRFRPRVRQE